MGVSRCLVSSLVLAAGLLVAAAAEATPVAFTIDPGQSSLTGSVSASFDISVDTSLGTFNGSGSVGPGALSSSPTGGLNVDWGSPAWDESITFSDLAMNNPNPGSASGGFSLTILGIFTANFTGVVNIQDITVALETPVVAIPDPLNDGTPNSAGPGPWTASQTASLLLGTTVAGQVQGTGLLSGVTFNIDPFSVPATPPGQPVPLTGELRRVAGGSELEFSVSGASISLPPGDPATVPVNECAVNGLFGCYLNINTITLTVTNLTLDNLTGSIVATSTTAIPEPATAGMLAVGLVGLTLAARRRRRR
jgi:hypothetical protein